MDVCEGSATGCWAHSEGEDYLSPALVRLGERQRIPRRHTDRQVDRRVDDTAADGEEAEWVRAVELGNLRVVGAAGDHLQEGGSRGETMVVVEGMISTRYCSRLCRGV